MLFHLLALRVSAECSTASGFTAFERGVRDKRRHTSGGLNLQGHYLHLGICERLHLGSYGDLEEPTDIPYILPESLRFPPGHLVSLSSGVGIQVDPDCWGQGEDPVHGDYFIWNARSSHEGYVITFTVPSEPSFTRVTCGRGNIGLWNCGAYGTDAAGANDYSFRQSVQPVSLEDISTESTMGAVGKVVHHSPFTGAPNLELTQTLTFEADSRTFKTVVEMCNVGSDTLENVKYTRGMVPTMDYFRDGEFTGSRHSLGTVKAQKTLGDPYSYVCVFSPTHGTPICYYSEEEGSVVYRGGLHNEQTSTDNYFYENPQAAGYTLDTYSGMTLYIPAGDIAAGACKTIEWFTILEDDVDAAVASGTPGGPPPTPAPTVSEYYGQSCQLDKVLEGIDLDPSDLCEVGENGWATFDHDSFESEIELTIEPKDAHNATFRDAHGQTLGALTDFREKDGRYVLACPQPEGEKTVLFRVRRPANLTEFGGEWVKLYPKDSWANVTNEYEPFTFNQYGGKVPLLELRYPAGVTDPDLLEGVEGIYAEDLVVYMMVEKAGDYEVKYGNPRLSYAGRWIANEFKNTLLRVGTPWAECSGDTLESEKKDVGAIIPAAYGHPNLNLANYQKLIAELKDTKVDVKVVLEVFNKEIKSWTSSTNYAETYTECYEAGNACPESHRMCEASYCELDTFMQIVADLKAASPGKVKVLGQVDSETDPSAYAQLDMDGFYFLDPKAVPDVAYSVIAIGEPLFDASVLEKADVVVTLLDTASSIGVWTPFSWYPTALPEKWAAMVTNAPLDAEATNPVNGNLEDLVDILVDRGYGHVYFTTQDDFTTPSPEGFTSAMLAKLAGGARRLTEKASVKSAPFWGCDDTKFHCKPTCYRRTGVLTVSISDRFCADAPMDPCACKCYHEAQWVCQDGEVVCEARKGAEPPSVVGDLVCESRGTPKPEFEAEGRSAGECEPLPTDRNNAPAQQCLDLWATIPAPAKEVQEELPVMIFESTAALLSLITLFY